MQQSKGASKVLLPSNDLLRPNRQLIIKHITAVMYLSLLPSLLYTLSTVLIGKHILTTQNTHLHFTAPSLLSLSLLSVALVWTLINLGPNTYFMVKSISSSPQTIGSYYRHGQRYSLRLLGLYIVYFMAVVGGLILFVIPGILAFKRYYLSPYYLVDQDLSIKAAMKASAAASKRYSGPIWGIIGIQMVFALASSFIGSLPTLGIVFAVLLPYGCIFLPALRYKEITS